MTVKNKKILIDTVNMCVECPFLGVETLTITVHFKYSGAYYPGAISHSLNKIRIKVSDS